MHTLIDTTRKTIIGPAFALLPEKLGTLRAEIMLLTIGLQESGLIYRDQLERSGRDEVPGPAMSLWQMERGGGVKGVLTHAASGAMARAICRERGVQPTPDAVWRAIETDDVLACVLARLLLWTDAHPLPREGDVERAWTYYLRVWRPGAAQRDYDNLRRKWYANYHGVLDALEVAA